MLRPLPADPIDESRGKYRDLMPDTDTLRAQARRYHRTRCAISMADCIAAEVARATSRPLATSDPHLLAACHAEDVETVALPDTIGRVWTPLA